MQRKSLKLYHLKWILPTSTLLIMLTPRNTIHDPLRPVAPIQKQQQSTHKCITSDTHFSNDNNVFLLYRQSLMFLVCTRLPRDSCTIHTIIYMITRKRKMKLSLLSMVESGQCFCCLMLVSARIASFSFLNSFFLRC